MMNFRNLEASIITLLGTAAAGRYRTVGYQMQAQGALEVEDEDRSVQAYFSDGEFPKGAGALNGPTTHDMAFSLDLTVSKAALGDLSVLENPAATALQLQTALASMQTAEYLVNQSWNEFADIVYQVLMDAENQDLGLSDRVANRWVGRMQKDEILRRGELVVLTGAIQLTARMQEIVTGDETGAPIETIDNEIEIDGDDVGKAGTVNEQ